MYFNQYKFIIDSRIQKLICKKMFTKKYQIAGSGKFFSSTVHLRKSFFLINIVFHYLMITNLIVVMRFIAILHNKKLDHSKENFVVNAE